MSASVVWDNPEKTALLLTFSSPWTWDEYEAISPEISAYFNSVVHDVDLIINLQNAGNLLPENVFEQLRSAYANVHLNLRRYILVDAPVEVEPLFEVADRYYTAQGGSLQFSFVNNLHEARQLVAQETA